MPACHNLQFACKGYIVETKLLATGLSADPALSDLSTVSGLSKHRSKD